MATLSMAAPFASHLATMAASGAIVARHGPLLANAVLLPPGALVMELLPYKWEWQAISQIYYNMTQARLFLPAACSRQLVVGHEMHSVAVSSPVCAHTQSSAC